jgi:type IV pilus assembly protein PilM
MQIFLVAAPKTIVEKYLGIMAKAGLELIAIETESIATTRSVTFGNTFNGSEIVMDFGSKGADLSVIKDNKLIFSQSIGTGSDMLTKAIASEYNLEIPQAEQYKRTYGLLPDQAEGKIATTIMPIMEIIVNEIIKTINYFKAHIQESTPSRIFITGDGAKLPGLVPFLKQRLGMETLLFDPVARLSVDSKIRSEVTQLATAGFAVATGLALKVE